MERPLRALRMGRIATRSEIGALLMTRMSAIAQLGSVPPLRERLQSALRVDRTTHAAIRSNFGIAVEPEGYWTDIGRSISSVSNFSALRQSGVLNTWVTGLPGQFSRVSVNSPAHSSGCKTHVEKTAICRQPAVCQSCGSP